MDYRNMTCETIRSKPLAQDCAGREDFVGTATNFEIPQEVELFD
jgi:hypothetical protein